MESEAGGWEGIRDLSIGSWHMVFRKQGFAADGVAPEFSGGRFPRTGLGFPPQYARMTLNPNLSENHSLHLEPI